MLSSTFTSSRWWSYSWPAGSALNPARRRWMLLTNPSTRQLRIVTWAMSTSAGVCTRIPMPPPAFWISAPRQSSVTSDAVMSNPAV